MLEDRDVAIDYRDYTEAPLTEGEIRAVLDRLNAPASSLLRRRDPVFRELGLTGEEGEAEIVRLMAKHPTLLQRPIVRRKDRAILGRPPEKVLEIV